MPVEIPPKILAGIAPEVFPRIPSGIPTSVYSKILAGIAQEFPVGNSAVIALGSSPRITGVFLAEISCGIPVDLQIVSTRNS